MSLPHLTITTPSGQPQKIRSTVYLGSGPYLPPALSESATVYGTTPSMRVVDTLVDDDDNGVLDIIRVGPGHTHGRLTATDAIVWRGTLADDEAAQIELSHKDPDSESSDSQTWSVSAVLGVGTDEDEIETSATATSVGPIASQWLDGYHSDGSAWPGETSAKGNKEKEKETSIPLDQVYSGWQLKGEYNIPDSGMRDGERSALVTILNRTTELLDKLKIEGNKDKRKEIQEELAELKEWADYQAECSKNPSLRRGYQCVVELFKPSPDNRYARGIAAVTARSEAALKANQIEKHLTGLTCSCSKVLAEPCTLCHGRSALAINQDIRYQQIMAKEILKLAKAWENWVPRSTHTEFIRLMVKELERLKRDSTNKQLGYAVGPSNVKLNIWVITIQGPKQTPYENGIFELELDIGIDWQQAKPWEKMVKSVSDISGHGMRVLTRVFHPDIAADGKVRNLEALYALVGFDLDAIAKAFTDMLSHPIRTPRHLAARKGVADMAKNQPNTFATIAREWTMTYAMDKPVLDSRPGQGQ